MSKKLTKEELKDVIPSDYTYGTTQEVKLNAKLFEACIHIFQQEMKEERKIFHPEQLDEEGLPDIQKTAESRESKVFYTDKGQYFLNLYLDLMSIHAYNIQEGVAVKKEEANGIKKVK